jgi:dTDP-4-dehydrorhamnose reductase
MDATEEARRKGDTSASELHVNGTYMLAKALAEAEIGLIQISTDAVLWQAYEPEGMNRIAPVSPFDVDQTLITSEYGRTKLRGECAALSVHPKSVVVRLGQVNTVTGGLMQLALKKALADEKFGAREDQFVSPILVEDVARAFDQIEDGLDKNWESDNAPQEPGARVFQMAASDEMTNYDIVRTIYSAVGDLEHVSPTYGRTPNQVVDRPRRTNMAVTSVLRVDTGIDLFLAAHAPVPQRS